VCVLNSGWIDRSIVSLSLNSQSQPCRLPSFFFFNLVSFSFLLVLCWPPELGGLQVSNQAKQLQQIIITHHLLNFTTTRKETHAGLLCYALLFPFGAAAALEVQPLGCLSLVTTGSLVSVHPCLHCSIHCSKAPEGRILAGFLLGTVTTQNRNVVYPCFLCELFLATEQEQSSRSSLLLVARNKEE